MQFLKYLVTLLVGAAIMVAWFTLEMTYYQRGLAQGAQNEAQAQMSKLSSQFASAVKDKELKFTLDGKEFVFTLKTK